MYLMSKRTVLFLLIVFSALALSACNLGASPEEPVNITEQPTSESAIPTRTLLPNALPTSLAVTVTPLTFPTPLPPSTSIAVLPPATRAPIIPTNTPTPISIVILSPIPGNIAAGNIQILGSAIHPDFLQYRLEYGPDPNPGNLWFPITGIVPSPILNGMLGIWSTNTGATPDGLYQIRLRVFLRDGSQQITVVNNLRVQNQAPTPIPSNTPAIPRPIASFAQDRTSGDAPLVVRFINQSQGQISSFAWDFGDGSNSNEINPTHTFRNPGVYNVILRVTGPGGTSNVSRQISVQSPGAPVADFTTEPASGVAPLTVRFTNRSTGNITSVRWDFGDGGTSTENNPTYAFRNIGTFNIILEVQGPGGTSRAVRQITVEDPQIPAPVAEFEPSLSTGETPLTVTFSNTSTGAIQQHLWDFNGDGITDSVEISPTHQYAVAGTFIARLTVIGPGGQNTTERTITVQAPPDAPVAEFSAEPGSGEAPLEVRFTNSTTGQANIFSWDFQNDGDIDSNDTNPTYRFEEPGTYTVVLTASGPGGSTTKQVTISVTNRVVPPQAGFTFEPELGEAPLRVQFTNTSSGTDLQFVWDFNGDGQPDSTEANPQHEYTSAGNYTVTLIVNSPSGNSSATGVIRVSEAVAQVPPTAAFTPSVTSGTVPLEVAFVNQSAGDITSYAWDFNGDGQTDSTETNPSTIFSNAGTYTVTLTAVGSGGQDSASQTIVVSAPLGAPVASFEAAPQSGTAPLTVTFTNNSQGQVDSFTWDFTGDGVADLENVSPASFTFEQPGSYPVTLTVSNAAGSNSISQMIVVSAPLASPVASFEAAPQSGTAPLTVTFTNNSQGQVDSFTWDFTGDGVADLENVSPASFTFEQPGSYPVTLTVSNAAGSNSISQTILVEAAQPSVVLPTGPIAFITNRDGNNEIYIANEDGSNPVNITNRGSDDREASWAPDGNRIAFVSDRDGNNNIYVIELSDLSVRQLTTESSNDFNPAWSPNGDKIAFVSDRFGDNDIFVMNTDGSNPVQISADVTNDREPAWSPDGNRILYTTDAGGENNIVVVNASDGLNLQQLTSGAGDNRYATWSPDGSRIVFHSNRSGTNHVYSMNSDGTDVQQLTFEGANRFAFWSPDSNRILFTSDRSGSDQLYIMNRDGSNVQPLNVGGGANLQGRWKR